VRKLFKKELREVYLFIRRNYSELVVIGAAILFLTIKKYHTIESVWLSSLLFLGVLPLLIIVIFLRKNPIRFGLQFGNIKVWCFHVLITILIGLPVLYFASNYQPLREFYTVSQLNPMKHMYETVVYMLGWEFIFRGFLLFGLKEKLKETSILVQMVPFVIVHFGKPEVETISTILMGIYLGYVAYRGNSFWPAFIIHVFINITFYIFVNMS
jgi:membrane protease YdiL (CAAX protease family)